MRFCRYITIISLTLLTLISSKIQADKLADLGLIKDGKLILPEDKYDILGASNYLKDLIKILINLKKIFKEIPYLEEDVKSISKFIIECEDLMKD